MAYDLESAACQLTTVHGDFSLIGFKDRTTGLEHAALVHGELAEDAPPLVRLHSECLTGDALGSCHCDCGAQLRGALQEIVLQGGGVVLYMRQEGRGIGLLNKIRAYALQERGADTLDANTMLGLPADARDYGVAAAMLSAIKVGAVRLMTNNPQKVAGLQSHGIIVTERIPLQVGRNRRNGAYLDTKAHRMGHLLDTLREPPNDE